DLLANQPAEDEDEALESKSEMDTEAAEPEAHDEEPEAQQGREDEQQDDAPALRRSTRSRRTVQREPVKVARRRPAQSLLQTRSLRPRAARTRALQRFRDL